MSYINWGSESPEQLALRRMIEEQALYEQAVRSARARAGQAPGVAGGGGDPLIGLYGVAGDGLIYSLSRDESNWQISEEYGSFPNFTQITLNTDDGYLYAVVDFAGTTSFIRIDQTTREFTFIENDIDDYSTKGASSLYYEGGGNFIYLDNSDKSDVSSIIRIELDGGSPEAAIATVVSEVDSVITGYTLRNIFLYDGATWAIAITNTSPFGFITGPFDIDAGGFIYSNILDISPSDSNIDLAYVFSTVEYRGIVYVCAGYDDQDNNFVVGLFKMDTETGGASAPYYLTFVKELMIDSAGGDPILSITHFQKI